MTYKTPGVYVSEINLFPPSVAQVETAIPAFVGYTEINTGSNGKSLLNLPVRIGSLLEFKTIFGAGYIPASYEVTVDGYPASPVPGLVTPDKRFYLYDSLCLFYDNGGGICYVVSAGLYTDPTDPADPGKPIREGIDALKKCDEPTLLVTPDAVGLPDIDSFTALQVQQISQCASLQDRFAILDIYNGNNPEGLSVHPVADFRNKSGVNNLNYGAAYYPWIISSYNYDAGFERLQLKSGGIPVTDLIPLCNGDSEKAMITALAARNAESAALPDEMKRGHSRAALALGDHVPGFSGDESLVDNFKVKTFLEGDPSDPAVIGVAYLNGLLDKYKSNIDALSSDLTGNAGKDATDAANNLTSYMNLLASVARCFKLGEDAASDLTGPAYRQCFAVNKSKAPLIKAICDLVSVELNPGTINHTRPARTPAIVGAIYTALGDNGWFGKDVKGFITYDKIVPFDSGTPETFTADQAGYKAIIAVLETKSRTAILTAYADILVKQKLYEAAVGQKLLCDSPGFVNTLLARYIAEISDPDNAGKPQLFVSMTNYLALLSQVARCFRFSEVYAGTAPGKFRSLVLNLKSKSSLTDALVNLVKVEKSSTVIANTTWRGTAVITPQYEYLEGAPGWFGMKAYSAIAALDGSKDIFTHDKDGCLAIIATLCDSSSEILKNYQSIYDAAVYEIALARKMIMASHTFFTTIQDKINETMRTMPPSGAIAGIYAMVDGTRGVWKAPANVSLGSVIGPAVKLDNSDQETLNVDTSGKSINAIRAFTGKGTLVWGARTLAGNDNEWRYIPVRRFFIMAEESIKKATAPFVFEPNDANTWMKVRSMIGNFLMLQWRAGALQGAKPEDAFYVNVGLNNTMTEIDILEGRMIIEIGMAVVRPAEFIVLRFSHKMLSGNS